LRENFDRFNFAIHKEKEMADFRKWIIVLFALSLLVGLGSAQTVPGNSNMVCNFNQTPTLPIRAESLTDATSDIVIGCVGGQVLTEGSPIPQATITVTLNAPITSRLIANSGTAYGNASEALLIIDEPGAALPVIVAGYGTNAPQTLCTTPGIGCTGIVHYTSQGVAIPVASWSQSATTGVITVAAGVPNVYQGVVNGNSVTFFGVPVLPPGTSNQQRTFRITNVRINATGFSAALGNVNPVLANVASNNALPLSLPTNTVGYVQTSLTTKLSGTPGYSTVLQCTGQTAGGAAASATLNYTELFSSAFKTRSVPLSNAQYSAQSNNPTGVSLTQNYAPGYGTGTVAYPGSNYGSGQSVPGALFSGNAININSESDFIFPIVSGGCTSGATTAACAGLADFGTRFKAVFTNIPAGVTVYVAVSNTGLAAPAGNSTTAYAQLVSSELAPEVTGAATATVSFGSVTNYLPLVNVGGSATAVWEVITANPNAIDTFTFPVYFGVTKNTTPALSAAYVQMWYAPTSNAGANFSATGALMAEGYGYPIPRFVDPTGSGPQVLQVTKCQTALLWPYVVTGATSGFETGLAISNTTSDGPLGTAPQNGSCSLYWYGQNLTAAGAAVATATPVTYGCDSPAANASACVGIGTTNIIASGTTWSNIASNLQAVPAGDYWVGYVIGICNFQMAHGYAAITDISVRNIISSYLALVLEGPNSAQQAAGFIARPNAPVTYEGNEQ
jgi:hypothetical protein